METSTATARFRGMRVASLIILLPAFCCACSGLGREFNQALPEFMRSDPGAKEKEIYANVRRAREWSEAELADQRRLFEQAREAFRDGRHDEAASLLEDYLERYPVSSRDEQVRFLLGRSHYEDDEYQAAFSAFKDFAELYVVSDHTSEVMEYEYRMGKDFIEGNRSILFGIISNRGRGEEILNHVVERFPNGERAPDAQWLLSRYYMKEESWEKAAGAFGFLADNYPDSEWFGAARYYQAYGLYRQVKGPQYDPGIIRRAREAFEAYLRQVPEGAWREDAVTLRDQLERMEAEHLLLVGEWYLDQGRPYSARYYFESTRVRFPGTPAAERARELLRRPDVTPPEERDPSGTGSGGAGGRR